MAIIITILATIGGIWISRWALNTYRFLAIYLQPHSLARYHHTSPSGQPPWAFITGASDGIGKGYAYELARQNFNLILHGRNAQKLCSVRSYLLTEFPSISIKTVLSDACLYGPPSYKEIKEIVAEIQDLHLTILINNVGTGTRPTGHVFSNFQHDIPSDIDAIINANARFPAHITRALLPLLLSHSKPSLLLTMGSIADIGSPYLSVYSATKAFGTSFSRALTREMAAEGQNIEVLAIMTSSVTETATENAPCSIVRPAARDFARAALRRTGCGWDVVEGVWTHAVLHAVTRRLPAGWLSGILRESVREEMKREGKSA
ncbi:hypothetical protein HYFRA_00006686 [Hymenoscyphus fraxineus]|uniref:NAD(P)-binding protein n=1 Tax=Hymenoscyphus fraxineus TaxID=746836 RepID=A0A9N9PI11_9HELO|nr:hypothetical protein HYFRA_00006686 [Hymenoscyphus fraxineus]